MTDTIVTVIAIVVAVLVVAVLFATVRKARRRRALRGTFGAEYDRTVEHSGKRREAERDLTDRQAAHDRLDIRALSPDSQARYRDSWASLQAKFVDAPVLAFTEADQILRQLMAERGYPTDVSVEERTRLLSVEHQKVIENYRAGHAIEQRTTLTSGNTEQIRQGMLHFRSVFAELLNDEGDRTDPSAEHQHITETDQTPLHR